MFTFIPARKELKPGQYTRAPGERRDVITVCCPECEGEYRLPRHYAIGTGGMLNPELHCPLHGCGWKKPTTLAKWGDR